MRGTGTPITDSRNGITRNRLDAPAALAALRSTPQGSARAELLVPVVLDVTGLGGARFVSELTLTNRGTTSAQLEAVYTAATGMFPLAGGSGSVVDTLAAGRAAGHPRRDLVAESGEGARDPRRPRPGGLAPHRLHRPLDPGGGLGARADDIRLLQRLGGPLVSGVVDGRYVHDDPPALRSEERLGGADEPRRRERRHGGDRHAEGRPPVG